MPEKIKLSPSFLLKDEWFLTSAQRDEIKAEIVKTSIYEPAIDEEIDDICAALVTLGYMKGEVDLREGK